MAWIYGFELNKCITTHWYKAKIEIFTNFYRIFYCTLYLRCIRLQGLKQAVNKTVGAANEKWEKKT